MRKAVISAALVLMLLGCAERECSTSLVDRFSQAHFVPETWLIDFGVPTSPLSTAIKMPGHRDPLVSGWSADEQWNDDQKTTFVWGRGTSSVLHLDRFGSRDLQLRFRCRPREVAGKVTQTITTFFNGSPVATTTLQPEFASYDVSIPASLMRAGRNVVEFRYAYDAPDLAVAWDWLEIVEQRTRPNMRVPRKEAAAVAVPYRSAIRYELSAGSERVLMLDGIVNEGETAPEDPGTVRITMSSPNAPAPLKTESVQPGGGAVQIEIPRSATELEIAALPPRGRRSGTFVQLRAPRVVHPCD